MDHLKNLCSLLYPKKCCHRILIEFDIFEAECLKTMFVKSLGYGIIFGSTMVKLPQLIKLTSAKSGIGVSLFSVLLELMALTLGSAYAYANKFPFSAWGESLFLMLMTSLIAFLIIYYDISTSKSFLFMVAFSSILGLLMSGHVSMNLLKLGQVSVLPLIISSKLIQAWANFRNGHTGNLSAITVVMIFIGSTTRIFTSIQETGDQLIIFSFLLSSAINLILVLQIFYYWDKTNEFIQRNLSKKEK